MLILRCLSTVTADVEIVAADAHDAVPAWRVVADAHNAVFAGGTNAVLTGVGAWNRRGLMLMMRCL